MVIIVMNELHVHVLVSTVLLIAMEIMTTEVPPVCIVGIISIIICVYIHSLSCLTIYEFVPV